VVIGGVILMAAAGIRPMIAHCHGAVQRLEPGWLTYAGNHRTSSFPPSASTSCGKPPRVANTTVSRMSSTAGVTFLSVCGRNKQ
jgi:hypothetical protein